MYIVHIASELAPIAKVGGLADVISGLSKELQRKGHSIDIIIPKYDCIDYSGVKDLKVHTSKLMSYYRGQLIPNTVWHGVVDGLSVYFLEPHNENPFFSRGQFYQCPDNVDRFTYFSRAALEFLLRSGKSPDCIHCHDWHTALIPVLYYEVYKSLGLKVKRIIFTIHNMDYQGLCDPFVLDHVGLNGTKLLRIDKLQDPQRHHLLNLIKGGVTYATYVTSVSPTYAHEVQTREGGCGLHFLMQHFRSKFSGILNGLDYDYWNPETDIYLSEHYNATTLEKKELVKQALKKTLSLESSDKPIVSCISRLVPQKGVDLIEHALFSTLAQGGQFILLGTSPDPIISRHFHALKETFSRNHNVHFELQYNEELSHQIYAGSDFFIVPSLFEPCGLTQLIALRYGTIPIVRRTGGLADTVFDVDYSNKPPKETNGYSFDHPDSMGVNSALDRALRAWFFNQQHLNEVRKNGMLMDFSWKRPSERYLKLYLNLA